MLAYLDIIGSVIIGGMMMMAVFRLDAQLLDRSIAANLSLMAQTNGASTAEVVERDLRRLGFEVEPDSTRLSVAGPTSIAFRGDVDDDGVVEEVRYRLATPNNFSPNPDDYFLIRRVDGVAFRLELGATRFELTYYDALGLPTTDVADVREIEVDMRVEVSEAYRYWDETTGGWVEEYPGSDWKFRVRPKNM
jgi:hypothetical protein